MIAADPLANLGPATIVQGNARQLPLPDASVDLIVTSPPYFALRSYTDDGVHYEGQIGSEATPAEFVEALLECTREMVRVLKPSGSIFVNLGDKYSGGGSGPQGVTGERIGRSSADEPYKASRRVRGHGVREKSLLGMPWRYALACIDDLGLILRAEVIWSKPNGLPESVTDRVRRSHEQWFHFVKEPRYFAAVDEIREPHSDHTTRYYAPGVRAEPRGGKNGQRRDDRVWHSDPNGVGLNAVNPLGKLPGSVREVPSAPLKVPAELGIDHFAAFPPAWPAWIIGGWSPTGICGECSEGRRPVVEGGAEPNARLAELTVARAAMSGGTSRSTLGRGANQAQRSITGYVCACPIPDAPTRPAVVLDPFGGTGATAMAARALGRHGITVDLSADYCQLARWRVQDRDELAAVRGHPRTGRVDEQQASLLDLIGEVS